MKIRYGKEFKFLGKWFNFGYSFRRIGFGVLVTQYFINVDLFFFWFGVEL